MTAYEWLKLLHILSATVLFGTGLGTAFFLWMADRSRDIRVLQRTCRHVIIADWLFTTPTALVQPITGVLLMLELGWPLSSGWFGVVAFLYLLVGACWIPVLFIQYRLRDFADRADAYAELPPSYHGAMTLWIVLGVAAFLAMIALFALMVFKPLAPLG